MASFLSLMCVLATLFYSPSYALKRAALFRKESKTLRLQLTPHDVFSFLLAEEQQDLLSGLAKGLGQSAIPGAVGLYMVTANKNAVENQIAANKELSEKQVAANKELIAANKELSEKQILGIEKQILSNKELIIANKELGLEIIKANEAKIENLLMKFLSDKNMIK